MTVGLITHNLLPIPGPKVHRVYRPPLEKGVMIRMPRWLLACLFLVIVAQAANGFSLGSGIGAKAPLFPMQRTQAAQIAGRLSAAAGPLFMSSSSSPSDGKKKSRDGLNALARRNAEEASVLGKFLEIRPPRPTQRLSDYVASTPAKAGEEAVVVGGGWDGAPLHIRLTVLMLPS